MSDRTEELGSPTAQLLDWQRHYLEQAKAYEADDNERFACYNHGEADAYYQASRLIEPHEARWQAIEAELAHLVRLLEPLERDIPGLVPLDGARAALARKTA